jgi:uncharacterized integral membrane protein
MGREDRGREDRGGDRENRTKMIVIGVLVIVLVAFVIANTETVDIDFIVTDVSIPLIFVLAGTAILGAIIDRLWLRRRRRN